MPPELFSDLWLPFVIASVVAAIGLWPQIRRRPADLQIARTPLVVIAPPLALSAALFAMHLQIVGKPAWPPASLTERLLPAFIAAGAIGCLAAAFRSRVSTGLLMFLAAAVPAAIAIWPVLATVGERALTFAILVSVAAASALSAGSLTELSAAGHPIAAAVVLAGVGFAAGGALVGSYNMVLGQFALSVGAAAIALIALTCLLRPRRLPSSGVATGFAFISTLLLSGNRYATLPAGPAALFACVAPGAFVTHLLLQHRVGPRKLGVLSVLVAGVVATAAMVLCMDLMAGEGYSQPEAGES